MAMRAKTIDVNRWQQGRPEWNYHPAMQFYFRFITVTLHEALQVDAFSKPTDEALLARDWFATSEPIDLTGGNREYVGFDACCHWLGIDADTHRVAFLDRIDKNADFDTDEAFERLEFLSHQEPEDTEALFEVPEMFRVVAVRDQMAMFAVN